MCVPRLLNKVRNRALRSCTCMRARRRRREVGGDNARKIRRTANCCQRGLKELKSSGEWKRWLAYKFRDFASTGTPPGQGPNSRDCPGHSGTVGNYASIHNSLVDCSHVTCYGQRRQLAKTHALLANFDLCTRPRVRPIT